MNPRQRKVDNYGLRNVQDWGVAGCEEKRNLSDRDGVDMSEVMTRVKKGEEIGQPY